MSYLQIFGVNPLSVTSFANISLHMWVIFWFLFIVSFVVQKLLSLSSPICLFLFLFSLLQEMGQKRSCCDLCQGVFLFSSENFIVSGLTFISLIHFEFIFVYAVRMCSKFILLQVVDQFSQHH